MKKCIFFCLFVMTASIFLFVHAEDEETAWLMAFKQALHIGDPGGLRDFYTPEFFAEEMRSLKHNISRGNLNFKGCKILPMTRDAILVYIPTSFVQYSNAAEEGYFDFIYRIYRTGFSGNKRLILARNMEEFNPDFKRSRQVIRISPHTGEFLIESELETVLESRFLIFKLAKEFDIKEFKIEDKPASFQRFGYIVVADVGKAGTIRFSVKGKIKAPHDHNQFLSLDRKGFFLRAGAFAAVPSPPPDNRGRVFFSNDETEFDITLIYPSSYTLLHYGNKYRDTIIGEETTRAFRMNSTWNDSVAFYAQNDWDVQHVEKGGARLTFYFPPETNAGIGEMADEVANLLDWIEELFQAPPAGSLNFAVVDKFYKGGLLNDGQTIIAQKSETILDGGYIHEVCHMAPQPRVQGNQLWIKEGFTNFLAFNWLAAKNGSPGYWRAKQRKYLHYFDLYEEPLSEILSTRNPCYWAAYQKGPWIYRMLESYLGADSFRRILLELGKRHGQILESTREYLAIFEEISGKDLIWFEEQWLNRRENPTLKVQSQLEKKRNETVLRTRITQTGTPFKLPVEIEIDMGGRQIRKTVWVESGSTEKVWPLDSDSASVHYDPDAKLFAVIKEKKPSFLGKSQILTPIPNVDLRYKSDISPKIIEFAFSREGRDVILSRIMDKNKMVLKMTKKLIPREFLLNGVSAFRIDPEAGRISFADRANDISEGIYPEEFIPALFFLVDWTSIERASLVFLQSGGQRCGIASAIRKSSSARNYHIHVDVDGSYFLELFIKDEILERYVIDGRESFQLIPDFRH